MTGFLGEIAFVVALDLTGRAVNVGFVTLVRRDAVVWRVFTVVLVGAVLVAFPVRGVEANVDRVLLVVGNL